MAVAKAGRELTASRFRIRSSMSVGVTAAAAATGSFARGAIASCFVVFVVVVVVEITRLWSCAGKRFSAGAEIVGLTMWLL